MKYYYIHPTENNDRMTSIKFKILKDTKLLTCKIELIDDEDNDDNNKHKDDDTSSKKIKSKPGIKRGNSRMRTRRDRCHF